MRRFGYTPVRGIAAIVAGLKVLVGNDKLLTDHCVASSRHIKPIARPRIAMWARLVIFDDASHALVLRSLQRALRKSRLVSIRLISTALPSGRLYMDGPNPCSVAAYASALPGHLRSHR